MPQYAEVMALQVTLEEKLLKKMDELAAQIQGAGPAKDTVAKVADEFRVFRELMFSMMGLLRQQIGECTHQLDVIETRHRRKALIFLGVPEADKEDCRASLLDIVHNKLSLATVTVSTIKACFRLGGRSKDHHRPILVKFYDLAHKTLVWKAKKSLKGSAITVREFLTKARQDIFAKARAHFGMRAVWSQDGIICVKAPDGSRHKCSSLAELSSVTSKFPKVQSASPATSESRNVTGTGASKPRK